MASKFTRAKSILREEGILSLVTSVKDYFLYTTGLKYYLTVSRGMIADETIEAGDISICATRNSVSNEMRGQLVENNYEATERELIQKHLEPNCNVIELGGGIGYISCLIDCILADQTIHIVVEPNPEAIRLLEKNKSMNRAKFEVQRAAYSSSGDTVELTIPDNLWGGSTFHNDGDHQITAKTVNIKNIAERYDLSTFVVVSDIEAAEAELIRSELDYLESHCRILIIEFHEHKEKFEDTCREIYKAKLDLEESNFDLIDQKSNVYVYRNSSL